MLYEHERTQQKLCSDLGAEILVALKDPSIIEVSLNPNGLLWLTSYQGRHEYGKMLAEQAYNLINTVATILGFTVTATTPSVGGEIWVLLDNAYRRFRFQGLIPPITPGPAFTIRKPAGRIIALEEYAQSGIITGPQFETLCSAVSRRQSMLIVGGTMSGKTTLANAILAEIAKQFPDDRVAIIEDTLELKCNVKNLIDMHTTPDVTMNMLLKMCLRMSPDRIVIGEVRGEEAYSLIKAWNTGHPGGLSTVHSNSARSGLLRLEQLIYEAGVTPSPEGIVEALNLIVYIEKSQSRSAGRTVREIKRLKAFDKKKEEYVVEEACGR